MVELDAPGGEGGEEVGMVSRGFSAPATPIIQRTTNYSTNQLAEQPANREGMEGEEVGTVRGRSAMRCPQGPNFTRANHPQLVLQPTNYPTNHWNRRDGDPVAHPLLRHAPDSISYNQPTA